MSDSGSVSDKMAGASGAKAAVPATTIGWWAVGFSVLGFAAWVVLPMITMQFRETYPITDTWVMPAIGMVLIDVAAVLNALCIWRWRERSTLNIIAAVLTIPAALFATLMVVGEGLGGA